jgi:hypothetical protein
LADSDPDGAAVCAADTAAKCVAQCTALDRAIVHSVYAAIISTEFCTVGTANRNSNRVPLVCAKQPAHRSAVVPAFWAAIISADRSAKCTTVRLA